MDEEDPRVSPHRCGVTRVINGKTWICVKDVHAKVYMTRRGPKFDTNPGAEQHYFVRQYPHGNH